MPMLRQENANVLTIDFTSGLYAWAPPRCGTLCATRYTVFISFDSILEDD
jgi:hypothetical protein